MLKEKRGKLFNRPKKQQLPWNSAENVLFARLVQCDWAFRIRVVLDLFKDLLIPVAVGELKITPVNHQMGEGVLQGKRC